MDESTWNEFSQRVQSETDIVAVISRYVELKSKGDRLWGICPFHSEKTPSFSVESTKGFFYCFGCHVGGDAFKFISLIENVSYGRAIEIQAERLGIERPHANPTIPQPNNEVFDVLQRAGTFFHNALTITSYGRKGLEYLTSRGFNTDAINQFNIGFAPDSWDKLLTSFQNRGYSRELLVRAGLIIQSKKNSDKFYDRFRNRVMIPIYDERGRIVGFGGRSIDGSEPKYLNSPETSSFNKRKILYGLNYAQRSIRDRKNAIICEGYMDAISLSKSGITNVVASLGTSFTEEQAKLLARYTQEFYFCYDSDSAGQNSTIRAITIAKTQHVAIKVIQIPNVKDPDEYIRKNNREKFEELIKNAQSSFEFQLNYEISQIKDQSIESRAQILRKMLPILLKERPIERRDYIKRLSMRLFIEESTIYREIEGKNVPKIVEKASEIVKDDRNGSVIMGGRYVLFILIETPEMVSNVQEILPNGFEDKIHQEIFENLRDGKNLENLSMEAAHELKIIQKLPLENKIQAYQDSLCRLRIEYLKKQKCAYVNEGKFFEAEELQKEINELKAELSR